VARVPQKHCQLCRGASASTSCSAAVRRDYKSTVAIPWMFLCNSTHTSATHSIHIAPAPQGSFAVVELLLQAIADLQTVLNAGRVPILLADTHQDEVVKHLEDGGARLVDGAHHRLALLGQILQRLHHLPVSKVHDTSQLSVNTAVISEHTTVLPSSRSFSVCIPCRCAYAVR
jgi:hypothetical protein